MELDPPRSPFSQGRREGTRREAPRVKLGKVRSPRYESDESSQPALDPGQQLLDRALANVINFPVVYTVALPAAITSLAVVLVAAALVLAAPGWLAARVAAAVALQD